jgi:hypothetical protein
MVSRKPTGCTYDTVLEIARSIGDLEEGTSYGTPALKLKKKFLLRLKEDGESIAIRIGFDEREILMQSDPDTFYITDHYRDYPAMLVHLSRIDRDRLRDILMMAIRTVVAKPSRRT